MSDLKDDLRAHSYITTYTGARFSYENHGPFRLADIAHSLSQTARFRGHGQFFYSVAQHSIMVAEMMRQDGCSKLEQAAGLLHDAHEAYVGDVPTPLKWACPDLDRIEAEVETALRRALLPDIDPGFFDNVVKTYDLAVLHFEARHLLRPVPAWVNGSTIPWGYDGLRVKHRDDEQVELVFLTRARDLDLL